MNRESEGKSSGIPHLAKNERDMGHPSFVREREALVLGSATTRAQLSDRSLCKLKLLRRSQQNAQSHTFRSVGNFR
jgi:hypothetical protein